MQTVLFPQTHHHCGIGIGGRTMIELLLGHLAGDYIFQTERMALGKSKPGTEGWTWCVIHCLVYSACIALFMKLNQWTCVFTSSQRQSNFLIAFGIAFITHFPIDRWSLGIKWMKLLGHKVKGPFAPCIYIGIDNGFHLILMWALFLGL
jgi:hypothetical protein